MTRNWREEMQELNPEALFIGDKDDHTFDEAIVGIGERSGQPALVVYSEEKMVEVLVGKGMSQDDAREYVEFNIFDAWVGDGTPIILR